MSHPQLFALINIIGGVTILSSYVGGILLYPDHREGLWGGVESRYRIYFVVSMLLAILGYLTFLYFATFKNTNALFLPNLPLGPYTLSILCIIFLSSAAIWMPATILYSHLKQNWIWFTIVIALWATAISLIGMTATVLSASIRDVLPYKNFMLVGLTCTALHCTIFDAIIWVIKVPRYS